MSKDTDLAWLAGIMEGEGTFAIYHQKRSGRNTDQLRATISITNTDPSLMNKVYNVFKGMGVEMHMHEYKNKKGSTKPVYDLQTARQEYIKIVCEILVPYLFGEKRAKSEMLLRFVNKRLSRTDGRREYDNEEWNQFTSFRSSETTREAPQGDDIVRS